MPCVKCGAEIIQGQRFCRNCGEPVEPDTVSAPQTTTITTDSEALPGEALAQAGKTGRPTKINTNPVSESSGMQTNLLETNRGSETQVMDSDPLPPSSPTPASAPNVQAAQTQPALDQVIQHQTNPTLNESVPLASSQPIQPVIGAVTTKSAPMPSMPTPSMYDTVPPSPHSATLSMAKPPQGSKNWIIAIGGIALFGLIFLAFLLIGRSNRPVRPVTTAPSRPAADVSSETYLSEEGAFVDDDETVITQKFTLGTAKFSLSNVSGNITIEGAEGSDAQIKVIKTGGSIEERQNIKIIYSTIGGNLSLKTPQLLNNNVNIAYEVKLPSSLSQVNIQAVSSKVKVSGIDTLVDIKTTSGAVELTKLVGASRVQTESGDVIISQSSGDIGVTASKSRVELHSIHGTVDVTNTAGDTKASFESSTLANSMKFESISGNIDVTFRIELNAELDASTTSGTVDVQGLGVEVQKSPGFSQATGRVGIGGPPLKIKTVSGNIKVKKV